MSEQRKSSEPKAPVRGLDKQAAERRPEAGAADRPGFDFGGVSGEGVAQPKTPVRGPQGDIPVGEETAPGGNVAPQAREGELPDSGEGTRDEGQSAAARAIKSRDATD